MPLTFRFLPPIGGILYWLRPGDRAAAAVARPGAADAGDDAARSSTSPSTPASSPRRSTCCSPTARPSPAPSPAASTRPRSPSCSASSPLLGLRDKVAFLGARPEVYGPLLIVFLFPLENLIVGSQIVFLCIWLGAASSKLNRHFPFVVSVMIRNTPWNRSRKAKAQL